MRVLQTIGAFLASATATAALGAGIATQFVLLRLEQAGAGAIALSDRLGAAATDILNLGPLYAGLLAIPLAAAFGLASLAKTHGLVRFAALMLAGAAAVLATLWGLEQVFPAQPISGATGALGAIAQTLAGAIGGALFALLSTPRRQA